MLELFDKIPPIPYPYNLAVFCISVLVGAVALMMLIADVMKEVRQKHNRRLIARANLARNRIRRILKRPAPQK